MAQILQAPLDKLIGLDMKHLKDRRALPALQAAIAGQQGSYKGEYVSTASGARIWMAMSCTPLRDARGQSAGGIAIVEDITEHRRSEEEIHHLAYYDPLAQPAPADGPPRACAERQQP
jgi:PAS domain-containing protein